MKKVYSLVKLKPDAKMSIDRHWETPKNVDDIWLAEKTVYPYWICRKPGFGLRGDFGNGAAFVYTNDIDEILCPFAFIDSPLFADYAHYDFNYK